MTKRELGWFVGSVAAVVLGFVLAVPFPTAGGAVAIGGILGLTAFLLHVFRFATTHDDQWVWQTPGKPRRDHRAERAAAGGTEPTGSTPEDPA